MTRTLYNVSQDPRTSENLWVSVHVGSSCYTTFEPVEQGNICMGSEGSVERISTWPTKIPLPSSLRPAYGCRSSPVVAQMGPVTSIWPHEQACGPA